MQELIKNRYRKIKKLGEGALGEVFLVFDRVLQKNLALKTLKLLQKSHAQASYLASEFEILSQLRHPHLVSVYDYGIVSGKPYFTSEWIEGATLKEFKLSVAQLPNFLSQLCHALDFIHFRGLIHGDLKPSNIMVMGQGTDLNIKLLDFGLACWQHSTQLLGGTLAYMAPEVKEGWVSYRSDLYSLGVILEEILQSKHFFEWLQNSKRSRYLQALNIIIQRLKNPDPQQRLSRASHVLKILNRYLPSKQFFIESAKNEVFLEVPELIGCEANFAKIVEELRVKKNQKLFFITGEHGTGKTRFVSELKRRLQLQQYEVLQGKDLEELSAQLGIRLGISELKSKKNKSESAYFEYFWSLWKAKLKNSHAIVVLPDILSMDLPLLKFVHYALFDPKPESVPAIAWILEGNEKEVSAVKQPLFRPLFRNAQTQKFHLRNFNQKQLSKYLRLISQKRAPIFLVKRLLEITEGNPLHLTEIIRAYCLKTQDYFLEKLDSYDFDSLELKSELQDLIFEQYQSLNAPSKKIVKTMAIYDEAILEETLANVLHDKKLQVRELCKSLEHFGVLKKNKNSYKLNRLWQQVAMNVLAEKEQQAAYYQLALELENQYLKNKDKKLILKMAWFFAKSHKAHEGRKYYVQAAQESKSQFDFNAAIYFSEKFIEGQVFHTDLLPSYFSLMALYEQQSYFDKMEKLYQDKLQNLSPAFWGEAYGYLYNIAFALGKRAYMDHAQAVMSYQLKQNLSPAQRVRILARIAYLACVNQDEEAVNDYLQQAQPLLKKINYDVKAKFYHDCGAIYHKKGDFFRALEHYKKSIFLSEKNASSKEKLYLPFWYYNLGVMLYAQKDYRGSIFYIQKAKHLFAKYRHSKFIPNMHFVHANSLYKLGQYADAMQYYQQLIRSDLEGAYHLSAIDIYLYMIRLLSILGAKKEASQLIAQAKSMFHQLNSSQLGLYYARLADHYFWHGISLKQAYGYYQKIKTLEIGSDQESFSAAVDLNQVHILLMQKKIEAAKNKFQKIKFLRATRPSQYVIRYDFIKAWLDFSCGKNDQALKMISVCLNDSLKKSFFQTSIEIYPVFIALLIAQNKNVEALSFLNQAAEYIDALKKNVPEEYQHDFLNQYKIKQIFNLEKKIKPQLKNASSPKKEMERPMQKNASKLDLMQKLLELQNALSLQDNFNTLLENILDAALELTNAQRCFLLLSVHGVLKKFTWEQVLVARHLDKAKLSKDEALVSSTILERVIQKNEIICINNVLQEFTFDQYQSRQPFKMNAVLAVPLCYQGKLRGILYLDSQNKSHPFEAKLFPLLQIFSQFVTLAIFKSHSIRELQEKSKHIKVENKKLKIEVNQQTEEISRVRRALATTQKSQSFRYDYSHIIGQSAAMQQIFNTLDKVTETKIPILILGESGTGKEMIARALHYNSLRKSSAFFSENCSAIPETLLESELFGHVKGAFTGAESKKEGLFKLADGGTIFLDEIGDLPAKLQPKLLRVLQEQTIRPVGSNQELTVDVRIISATHANLKKMVKEKSFRKDLFFRLNGLSISLPPLRERQEDIPILIDHFIKKYGDKNSLHKLDPEALAVLTAYSWPGNIRELENLVQNAILFAKHKLISVKDLSFKEELFQDESWYRSFSLPSLKEKSISLALSKTRSASEKEKIIQALQNTRFQKTNAAKLLGITRKTLYQKLNKYGLENWVKVKKD